MAYREELSKEINRLRDSVPRVYAETEDGLVVRHLDHIPRAKLLRLVKLVKYALRCSGREDVGRITLESHLSGRMHRYTYKQLVKGH